jgi:O-acetyl-ADP-ribose deacetylase (regulator of RNase III)
MMSSFCQIAKFLVNKNIPFPFQLIISRGSVLEFHHKHGAIVNAANQKCLGGGGVDGAISTAGGPKLLRDRLALPILVRNHDHGDEVRCPTGEAKMTGPNEYGSIGTPYVIHAVGPHYSLYKDFSEPDRLLKLAYRNSIERGREAGLEAIAFSLISAGVYRGSKSVEGVLSLGMESICEFGGYPELKEVHLFAHNPVEEATLLEIANKMNLKPLAVN